MSLLNYCVDLIFIVLFVVIIVRSAKKGLVKTIIDFLSLGISAVSSALLSGKFSPVVYTTFVEPLIRSKLCTVVNRADFDAVSFTNKLTNLFNVFPKSGLRLAESFGLGNISSFISSVKALKPTTNEDFVNAFLNKVSYSIMIPIVKIVLFVVLAILITFLVKAFAKFFSKILKKIPFVGSADTFLGGVLGLLKGAVFVLVLCTVLYFFVLGSGNEGFVSAISSSLIYKFVSGINPLINYFV